MLFKAIWDGGVMVESPDKTALLPWGPHEQYEKAKR